MVKFSYFYLSNLICIVHAFNLDNLNVSFQQQDEFEDDKVKRVSELKMRLDQKLEEISNWNWEL